MPRPASPADTCTNTAFSCGSFMAWKAAGFMKSCQSSGWATTKTLSVGVGGVLGGGVTQPAVINASATRAPCFMPVPLCLRWRKASRGWNESPWQRATGWRLSGRGHRQPDRESRARPHDAVNIERAAVAIDDDRTRDRKALAGALADFLGRKEGV